MQNTIGVRVDDDLLAVIAQLAEEDQRTPAAMMRILTLEALTARGIWPPPKSTSKPRRKG